MHGVYGGWYAPTLTNREVCMLKFVEDITNEPEWWLKVREPETVLQWKRQVLELPWAEYRPHADFTETMADAVSNGPDQPLFQSRLLTSFL